MSRIFDSEDQKVATLHQHITDTGEPGYSGRYDPKLIIDRVKGRRYELARNGPCDLCEEGDIISPWKRQLYSTYRPGHRFWHEPWRWMRMLWGRIRAIIGL